MNAKEQSPVLRGMLAVFSPEIGSSIMSDERFEIGTIEVLDPDRLINPVLSLSSDRIIMILRSPGSQIFRQGTKRIIGKRSKVAIMARIIAGAVRTRKVRRKEEKKKSNEEGFHAKGIYIEDGLSIYY